MNAGANTEETVYRRTIGNDIVSAKVCRGVEDEALLVIEVPSCLGILLGLS